MACDANRKEIEGHQFIRERRCDVTTGRQAHFVYAVTWQWGENSDSVGTVRDGG